MRFIMMAAVILLLAISSVNAQTVNLLWDASPTEGVAGYKVHYQPHYPRQPFRGKGADQGDSPIDVGNVLEFTVTGLSEVPYHFAVSAYDAQGNESAYSNVVRSKGSNRSRIESTSEGSIGIGSGSGTLRIGE